MSDIADPSSDLHGDSPAAASKRVLPDRNALAAVAVERTRMPMVVSDPRQPDCPVVLANKAFLDLTGYAADEVIGRNCRFLQGQDTCPDVVAAIRRALEEERDIEVEILNYRKDGSAFWNQLNLSPVHDDRGRLLYVFGSQIDVTELRKIQVLEASEHRLLLEVDHRARNVLAVVGGIVRLSRAETVSRYADAVQERVQVLARSHTLLADRGWQEIPLGEIIRSEIGDADAGRVRLSGPEVMVSALVVQPMSMVIHELLQNAHVHGALSRPTGTLEAVWERGASDGAFTLHWREQGGPAYPPDAAKGFGSAMIAGVVERQLGGCLARRMTEGGFEVTITAPGTAVQAKS